MNIGFLVPDIVNCGPVNVVVNLIKNLYSRHNVNIMLISVRKEENDIDFLNQIKEMCSLGVHCYSDYLEDVDQLFGRLDVLHSHGYYPDKIASNYTNHRIKKITTVHCMFYQDYPKEYGFFKGVIGAFLHFKFLKNGNFSHIVGCSDSVKTYCNKVLENQKVVSINNGVDSHKFFKLDELVKSERKSALGYEKYQNIYIFSGRLIKRKRVPDLIQIFKKNATNDDVLLILGDGEDMAICKDLAQSSNIEFLGMVNNPEQYYQIADYVISNSSAEGYPMSIIEAVSCGCYALLSDIPPHREFIQNNPQMSSLIDHFKRTTREQSYTSTDSTKKLSAEVMTASYFDLYEH